MEIILKQDFAALGYKYDIVKVRDGYGRNYLIPNKIAVIANKSNLAERAELLRQQEHKLAKLLAEAQATAEKMATLVLDIPVKANEKGKIFGRVTTAQIAEALAKQGLEIDKRIIIVEDINQLGEYVATVKLHREVKGEVKLNVIAAQL